MQMAYDDEEDLTIITEYGSEAYVTLAPLCVHPLAGPDKISPDFLCTISTAS
jgi:hypothetical protein